MARRQKLQSVRKVVLIDDFQTDQLLRRGRQTCPARQMLGPVCHLTFDRDTNAANTRTAVDQESFCVHG